MFEKIKSSVEKAAAEGACGQSHEDSTSKHTEGTRTEQANTIQNNSLIFVHFLYTPTTSYMYMYNTYLYCVAILVVL